MENKMKYKKRYNILLSMMLLIIVGSVAVLFTKDKLDHVSGDNAGDIVDIVDNDANSSENPDTTLQRANFNNFSTALKHSQAFLKRTDYYKTRARGVISQDVKGIATITQYLGIDTKMDNKTKTAYSVIGTWGEEYSKIKENTGFEFVTLEDGVSYRRTHNRTPDYSEFDFTNEEVIKFTTQEFMRGWAILPEKVFTTFTVSKVRMGTMTKPNKDGVAFRLSFTVDKHDILDDATVFIKTMCRNTDLAKSINPAFEDGVVTIDLDMYGRPITAKFSFKYELDLRPAGIPLSGLKGALSYTQRFYDYGKVNTIAPLPERVEK